MPLSFFRAISNLLRFDRTNWKALALCFFAATIFWIFNALNKNYAANVRYPLQFEYDVANFIPVDPLPASLTLNVSGNGWELLRKSVNIKIPPISMALERPAETRKIATSNLLPVVASQLGVLQLNYIVTDTLRLKIEPRATRKIRLEANLKEVSFRNSFGRTSPVVILPDSITLEGPKSLIDNLNDTVVVKVTASSLNSNFRETLEIPVANNELIRRNPPVAEVMFEVGAMDEIERKLKLKMQKIPWGIEIEKDCVRCLFRVPQKDRMLFLTEVASLSASFTLIEMTKGETVSFLPKVEGLPPYVSLVLIDSVKVKKN